MVNFSLDGKIAVISGASRGIGEAIARLMEKGYQCSVLTDQFGNKKLVADALASRGLNVKLEP